TKEARSGLVKGRRREDPGAVRHGVLGRREPDAGADGQRAPWCCVRVGGLGGRVEEACACWIADGCRSRDREIGGRNVRPRPRRWTAACRGTRQVAERGAIAPPR